jgi:methyl-accepting chemotaxis protein
MRISTKLKILIVVTLSGLGMILFMTMYGLNRNDEAEATSHRMKNQVTEALEIKASAISTIMLDPTVKETRDVFSDAEKNIALHGKTAMDTIRRAEVKAALKHILQLWEQYDQDSQGLIKLAVSDPKSANDQLIPLYNREFKPLQAELEKFVSRLQQDSKQAYDEAETVSKRTYWTVIALILAVTVICCYFVLNLSIGLESGLKAIHEKIVPLKAGDLTQRLPTDRRDELSDIGEGVNAFIEELQNIVTYTRRDADDVANASALLALSSEQVLASSNNQSEVTSAIAAAVEEFSVSIDQVAENAGDAEKKATTSGALSHEGSKEVQTAVSEIQRIEQTVNHAVDQMEHLNQQALEISGIVNVIKDVAEQTNLLALNAAIEAARAGDMGRGFAVVADEVRKLAERTTKSAQEITEMITSVQSHTEAAAGVMKQGNEMVKVGVKQAEQAGYRMTQINAGSESVTHAITDISSALREQRIASTEIAQNVERIAHLTEENSAAISQVASAAVKLRALSEELQQGVARFKV